MSRNSVRCYESQYFGQHPRSDGEIWPVETPEQKIRWDGQGDGYDHRQGHSQERIHPEFGRKQEGGIPAGTYERLLPHSHCAVNLRQKLRHFRQPS